jgi:hypothetical protein
MKEGISYALFGDKRKDAPEPGGDKKSARKGCTLFVFETNV